MLNFLRILRGIVPHLSRRCVWYTATASLLGFAFVAYAQDSPPAGADPWIELFKAGGLPAVLAAVAYQFGRWVDSFELVVKLHEDDRRLIVETIERLKE